MDKSVRNLLNEVEAPERLSYVSDMYNSLVENGIQSPFFHQIVQAFIAIMGGGANPLAGPLGL